jgi:hypothetical protein
VRRSLRKHLYDVSRYDECWDRCEHEQFCLECCYLGRAPRLALRCREHGWVEERGHGKQCKHRPLWVLLCAEHFKELTDNNVKLRATLKRAPKLRRLPRDRKQYLRTRTDSQLDWRLERQILFSEPSLWDRTVSTEAYRRDLIREARTFAVELPERLTDEQVNQIYDQWAVGKEPASGQLLAQIINSTLAPGEPPEK